MGKSGRVSFAVSIVFLALVINGCSPPEAVDRVDTDGGAPASAKARGDNGDGTYTAPETTAGPAVFIALNSPYSAYNNKTAGTNKFDNTMVLNQVLADPFVVDGDGTFLLNSDVLVSAELTSQDPQVVTYRIKPNVMWSDGAKWDCDDFYLAWLASSGKAVMRRPDGNPVTADDGKVVTYFHPATTRGYQWANGTCRDDLTFVETYQTPYVDWRWNYIQNAILPAHVLERMAGIPDITAVTPDSAPEELQRVADVWNSEWLGFTPEAMPASGPYRFESSEPGGQTVLVRNERWAGNPGGPERIVFTPVANGADAVQGLQDQAFNVVTPPADPVLTERLRSLASQGVVSEVRGGPSAENLDLNLAAPLFQDMVVRTALAECIDRNELVEKLVRGVDRTAQPLGSLVFLPGAAKYEDHYTDKMPANTQQAQFTLERAGWQLGADGVYSRNGQRLTFVISHDGSPSHTRAAELIRTQCRLAGMEIVDGAVPGGLDEALAAGSFDVALTTHSLMVPVSAIADRYSSGGENNYQGYSDPEVDDTLGVAEREYAESFRVDALGKVDRLVADDLVSFPLFQIPVVWAYSDNIDNVFFQPLNGVTWNANEWKVS